MQRHRGDRPDAGEHTYTTAAALLLAAVDETVGQLSGPTTKRILWRRRHVFADEC